MATDDTRENDPQTAIAEPDTETAVDAAGEATEEQSDQEEQMAKLKEAIEVEKEEIGSLRLKMTVTVPREIIEERLSKQFTDLKREAAIPGFRKGHAPLRLVEKRFGNEVGDELKGQLVGSAYMAAVEKEELTPLGDPLVWATVEEERTDESGGTRKVQAEKLLSVEKAIDHIELPKEGPLSFTCELELKPKFELPKLEKIPVERPKLAVEDSDVEEELRRMRMYRGTFQPVEKGPTQRDDMLYVDLKMLVDGDVLLDEQNTDLPVRDVRLKGIPLTGLGDALEGKKRDEEITFEATAPDDHENADIRGKKAKLEIVIREIKRLELPPIDEDFVKSMGCETEEELRQDLRGMLESRLEQMARDEMHEQLGDYLIANTSLDIPEGLSHRQTERSVARRMVQMYQSGVPESEISKAADEMRAKAHDQVVRDLKLFFILEKIAEEREVDVTEEQLNGAIAAIAQRSGKRFDRVRDELSKGDGLMTLYVQLRDRAVLDLLLGEAEIKEADGPKTLGAKSPSGAKKSAAPAARKSASRGAAKQSSASKEKTAPTTAVKKSVKKSSPKKAVKKKKST